MNLYYINWLHLFWDSFEWICLQIKSEANNFSSLVQDIVIDDWIVIVVYYFQIWKTKENNIFISRVISSHMGPMYIETHNIILASKKRFCIFAF